MKLTVGRMAHVKVEKGCAEALLMGVDDQEIGNPVWRAVALRSVEQKPPFAVPMELSADLASVHEPYGCMREIVMLPAPPDLSHDSIPFFKQESTPGAQIDPGALPRLMQDLGFDPVESIVADNLTKERYGWRCGCGAMEQALYSGLNAAMQAGGAHRCSDGVRRAWSATWNAVT